MKKLILVVSVLFMFTLTYAGNKAIGLVFGYPDAVNFRLDMNKKTAIDAYLGWDYADLWFGANYVMKKHMIIADIPLETYFGGGVLFTIGSRLDWVYDSAYPWGHYVEKGYFNLGIRGIIGADYFINSEKNLSLFIETGPGMAFAHFYFRVWGGAGIRYYF